MTTIAWDSATLAGDTRCERGYVSGSVETKVWKLQTPSGAVLFGGSGCWQDCLLVKEWIEQGMPREHRPSIDPADGFNGILVAETGVFRLGSKLVREPMPDGFDAIGSGSEFAVAAMHCGRTAIAAVEVVAVYDKSTGGRITSVRLD